MLRRLAMTARMGSTAMLRATRAASLHTGATGAAADTITCKAAVAFAPQEPLQVREIEVAAPQGNEVRAKVLYSGVCHTDAYTLGGQDPEANWEHGTILGHEGVAEIVDLGPEVNEGLSEDDPKFLSVGDLVVPAYIPDCGHCNICTSRHADGSRKSNLCNGIRETQGQGLMPDGTSRFSCDGEPLLHYMGTSTFSQYTVLPEIAVAKIQDPETLPSVESVCLLGCAIPTGVGAVLNTSSVEPGSTVAVFGLGGVGVSVCQGARMAGAARVIGIDTNPDKYEFAQTMGATEYVNPLDHDKPIQEVIVEMTDGGVDYSFESTGHTEVMRAALECCAKGWGQSCIIGVAEAGAEISTRPFQLVTGRRWVGTAFGGVSGRTEISNFVDMYKSGELKIDEYITHRFPLEDINEAFELMEKGESIRSVIDLHA